jgi:hypothetical protein
LNQSYSQSNDFPPDDEARRKQADGRRPMIMRRILVWDMDEKLDLEDRFRKQLARVSGDVSNTHISKEEASDGSQ